MAWTEYPITNGVVRTRDKFSLRPGEVLTASKAALRPGDPIQVHRDDGRTEWSTGLTGSTIIGIFYLSFENATDILLAVTVDASNTYFEKATAASASGSYSIHRSILGSVATRATVVHRGDQYFLGTDIGNYMLYDDSGALASYDMGMQTPNQETSSTDVFFTTRVVGSAAGFVLNDNYAYYATEYDSVFDVESDIGQWNLGSKDGEKISDQFTASGGDTDNAEIRWDDWIQANERADSIKIYRAFLNNSATFPDDEYNEIVEWDTIVIRGGLLQTVTTDFAAPAPSNSPWIDEAKGVPQNDPLVPHPVLPVSDRIGSPIYKLLVQPRNFTISVLHEDSVVVAGLAESGQIIRWSPSGYPEYQPDPYFTYFATNRSDEVVGLHSINDVLVILTKSGVNQIGSLPQAGALRERSGRLQQTITNLDGCVGRHASTVVQTEQGEFVVWLSKNGLRITNGAGWRDACEDWSVEAAEINTINLDSALLLNNEKHHRLELYLSDIDANVRWDFYYHPTHRKQGGFKVMGPHYLTEYSANNALYSAIGASNNQTRLFVATRNTIYLENQGEVSGQMEVETGNIGFGQPFNEVDVVRVGATHGAEGAGKVIDVEVTCKDRGYAETSVTGEIDAEYNEATYADICHSGNYARVKLTSSNQFPQKWGPVWLKTRHRRGAA